MVVGLYLHEDMNIFLVVPVDPGLRIREEAATPAAPDNRGVILVRRENALAVHFEGIADHGEQRFFLTFAVNIPGRIEYLVSTVLGVRLCKHHELNIGRIPFKIRERLHQVVDFIFGERQPQA